MAIIPMKPLFPTKSNVVLRNKNLEMHWISYLWNTSTRLKILGACYATILIIAIKWNYYTDKIMCHRMELLYR